MYYNGNNVAGYRDAGGQFYDPQGQPAIPNAVITNSSVRPRLLPGAAPGRLDARAFRRARTYAVFQPRVSARLAVSRFASAFAYADRTAQAAPDALRRASLADYEDRLLGSGSIGNPDLRPERATTYGIGGRAEA